jgi:hypothetical protein
MSPMTGSDTFRIDLFGRYGAWMAALFAPLLWLAWPHFSMLLVVAVGIFMFVALLLLVGTIEVSDRGLVLYRVNRVTWSEITAVKRTSFLGLPYLFVFRTRGFRWSLPLYIRRVDAFKAALLSRAPLGHPLRNYAEGDI